MQAEVTSRRPSRKRRLPRREWSRGIEGRSLQERPGVLRSALANWKKIDSRGEQLALARENAIARGRELTLAYRNVIHVTSGFRRRRTKAGRERLVDEPCIVFIVRRKWDDARHDATDEQRLPRALLAWGTVAGKRELCAIPTDVQEEAHLYAIRPRGASMGWIDDPSFPEGGTVGCVVEMRVGAKTQRLAASALHVFTPRPGIAPPAMNVDRGFFPIGMEGTAQTSPVVAKTSRFGGALRDASTDMASFDVQLAQIRSVDWMRDALGDMAISQARPHVVDESMFHALSDSTFDLMVPSNHPKRPGTPRPRMTARFSKWLDGTPTIPYAVANDATIDCFHARLVELEVAGNERPLPGDSGSAVAIMNDDGTWTLAGLFIASHDTLPLAYMIPAFDLLDPSMYFSLPDGAKLRVVSA